MRPSALIAACSPCAVKLFTLRSEPAGWDPPYHQVQADVYWREIHIVRKRYLAAAVAGAAAALLVTSAGLSSATPLHPGVPALSHATLTAAATTTEPVDVGTFSCPTGGLAAVACETGIEADIVQAEAVYQASQLGAGSPAGGQQFVVDTSVSGGIEYWTVWAIPA